MPEPASPKERREMSHPRLPGSPSTVAEIKRLRQQEQRGLDSMNYILDNLKLCLWEWGLRKSICPFCNLPLLPLPKKERLDGTGFVSYWVCPSEGCKFNK